MKKAAVIALALIAIVLVTCSCKNPSTSDPFPLATGDLWKLTVIDSTANRGGGHDTSWVNTDSMQLKVPGTATVQGKSAWIFVVVFPNQDSGQMGSDTSYFVKDTEQIVQYTSLSDTTPSVFLELPLAANASWVSSIDGSDTTTTTVVGKETVTVPAGAFTDCWKLKDAINSSPDYPRYTWVAGGVGIVQMRFKTMYVDSSGTDTTTNTMLMKLKSYTVN